MTDAEREYVEARAAFVAALKRLNQAKVARGRAPGKAPGKADLAREAAMARDDRIAARYAEGVTSPSKLAREFSVSPLVARIVIRRCQDPAVAQHYAEWREATMSRIRAARADGR
jgi:hypothetical protein